MSAEDERLGLNVDMTRRDIVNGALAGAGAALLAGTAGCAPSTAQNAFDGYGGVGDYASSNGNVRAVADAAHRIRDATFSTSPDASDLERYDLLIVGGGPAGLLAAYEYSKLTGNRKRCLIVENHPIFGGAAKQNDFLVDGVRLTGPQASNDFGVPQKGSDTQMDQLFDELNLPREYQFRHLDPAHGVIRFALDNYANMDGIGESLVDIGYYFGRSNGAPTPRMERDIWSDDLARTPFSVEDRRDLLAWRRNEGGDASKTPEELDSISYRDFLEQVKGWRPAVTKFARPMIGLLTGLSPEAVSARAASRFVFNRPTLPLSFPGGNSGFVLALIKKMFPDAIAGAAAFPDYLRQRINLAALDRSDAPVRLRLGATALRVRHAGADKVELLYERGGRLHHAEARAIVMASGGWVNRRILADMPDELSAAYQKFVHAPALVINVALKNWRFLHKLGVSAARWFDDESMLGFCGNIRAPMLTGPDTPPLDPDRPVVFTLYTGLYKPGETDARVQTVEARTQLYATPYRDYERILRAQMTTMFASHGFDPARDIAGMVINRWGHARLAQPPGFFFGANGGPGPLQIAAKGYGRVIIAHSELNGAQNMNGAFQHGARAAQEAEALA